MIRRRKRTWRVIQPLVLPATVARPCGGLQVQVRRVPDYDLCSSCKAKDLHNIHNMVKMVAQAQDPLDQLGSHRLPEAQRNQAGGCKEGRGTQNSVQRPLSPYMGPAMANRCMNKQSCTKKPRIRAPSAQERTSSHRLLMRPRTERSFKMVGSLADAPLPLGRHVGRSPRCW